MNESTWIKRNEYKKIVLKETTKQQEQQQQQKSHKKEIYIHRKKLFRDHPTTTLRESQTHKPFSRYGLLGAHTMRQCLVLVLSSVCWVSLSFGCYYRKMRIETQTDSRNNANISWYIFRAYDGLSVSLVFLSIEFSFERNRSAKRTKPSKRTDEQQQQQQK